MLDPGLISSPSAYPGRARTWNNLAMFDSALPWPWGFSEDFGSLGEGVVLPTPVSDDWRWFDPFLREDATFQNIDPTSRSPEPEETLGELPTPDFPTRISALINEFVAKKGTRRPIKRNARAPEVEYSTEAGHRGATAARRVQL